MPPVCPFKPESSVFSAFSLHCGIVIEMTFECTFSSLAVVERPRTEKKDVAFTKYAVYSLWTLT